MEVLNMKWFKKDDGKIKAKKNNFEFVVIRDDYCEFKRFYVFAKDLKTDKFINTSWGKVNFKNEILAKDWCEEFAKKYKDARINENMQDDIMKEVD
jgi:hypothetical protein